VRILIALLLVACARPEARVLAPDVEAECQSAELRRQPSAEVRALLSSPSGAVRMRAALAAGRIGDAQAAEGLAKLMSDPEAGETAAWALGRIEGGQVALVRCLGQACPSAAAAARALAGPAAAKTLQIEPLLSALRGPAADEAAVSLGVLARTKEAKFPPETWGALAAALPRSGAAYALSRLPRGTAPDLRAALAAALRDANPWTRSLAARAWGKQELPGEGLAEAFADPDWRVRVEAARGLASAPGAAVLLAGVVPQQTSPQVLVALFEAAAQIGEAALPAIPLASPDPVVRCAAAQARDRIRKQLIDTPGCASGKAGATDWRDRARTGELAAELGIVEPAREALRDPDARVRGAAAGAAGPALAEELKRLLGDPDPYVVQEAAGTLAKTPEANSVQNAQGAPPGSQIAPGGSGSFVQNAQTPRREAALAAVQRLLPAHQMPAGDPQSDALTALVELTGPLPQLLPTPNAALAAALKRPPQPIPVPTEARAMPAAHRLRIRTSRGELSIDLRPDVAPLTSSALAGLAGRHFYDGLTFHRIVPDFVVQGGDPRGDGDGGPGWALPDEHSPLRFLRGTLGIATNGPETGGSQFFLCHSPQPHLDGRYTIAGQLRAGDDVLDALQPGDTILAATAE
jgi:cyclophilin family peptidyl-prolyl cis-trans isomerase/HEAT repeat protein